MKELQNSICAVIELSPQREIEQKLSPWTVTKAKLDNNDGALKLMQGQLNS